MITTSAPPYRSRVFEIALGLSLLMHLLVLLVYLGVFARVAPLVRPAQTDEPVAVSDVIRLEKRTIPRPQVHAVPVPPVAPQPPTPPQPVARQAPPPEPIPRTVAAPKPVPRHEIARVVPRAQAQPRPAPSPANAQPRRQVALNPSAPQSRPQSNLEDAQPSQEQRYLRAIAQSKSDLENIPPSRQAPSAIRQLNANMLGATLNDLQHAQGQIEHSEPCDRYSAHCYFVRARIIYSDGFVELVDVPWPFIFAGVRIDPIQIANGRYFTPPPPPNGYRLPHPFAPSRFVCAYFHDECKALFDAEQAAGGQPASASSSN
jgi:outer membrane biosynthesis protein TonB